MKSPTAGRRRSSAKPTIANLAALGAERLAELLLAAAKADPALMRALSLTIAATDGALTGEIDKQLARLRQARGLLNAKKVAALKRELANLAQAIVETLGSKDPAAGLERLLDFLGLAQWVLDRQTDNGQALAEVFRSAAGRAGELVARVTPAAVQAQLVRSAYQVFITDQCDIAEDLISTVAQALDQPGRDTLRAMIEADLQKFEPQSGAGSQSLYRFWMLTGALADVADVEGDVDGFIAAQQRRGPRVRDDAAIATRLLEAGRAQDALAAIDAAELNPAKPAHVLADLRIQALDALGRREEAQAARWAQFQVDLSVDSLRAFLKRLPDFEDFEREQEALELVRRHPDTLAALDFLSAWPDFKRAGALVRERLAVVDGDAYWVLAPAAERLGPKDPLAAILLYRLMIDFALERGRSARYGHAARHLQDCSALAGSVLDWEGWPTQAAYLAGIEREHGRKFSFWNRVTVD